MDVYRDKKCWLSNIVFPILVVSGIVTDYRVFLTEGNLQSTPSHVHPESEVSLQKIKRTFTVSEVSQNLSVINMMEKYKVLLLLSDPYLIAGTMFFWDVCSSRSSGQKRLRKWDRLICLPAFCSCFYWDIMESVACFVCRYLFSYMSTQGGTKNMQPKFNEGKHVWSVHSCVI